MLGPACRIHRRLKAPSFTEPPAAMPWAIGLCEQEEVNAQAVHDEVPPDVLSPVLRQLVDQFVHDRARPEVMSLGLKTVRTLCERAPLVMTPELLQVSELHPFQKS